MKLFIDSSEYGVLHVRRAGDTQEEIQKWLDKKWKPENLSFPSHWLSWVIYDGVKIIDYDDGDPYLCLTPKEWREHFASADSYWGENTMLIVPQETSVMLVGAQELYLCTLPVGTFRSGNDISIVQCEDGSEGIDAFSLKIRFKGHLKHIKKIMDTNKYINMRVHCQPIDFNETYEFDTESAAFVNNDTLTWERYT